MPSARRSASTTNEPSRTVESEREARVTVLDIYELSRRIRVPVSVDKTGWLRNTIELVFERLEHGIHPTAMRVGAEASAADVRKLGNVFDLCERYNSVIHQLRLISSTELMEKITDRQEERMGYRSVKYFTLEREVEFLDELLKELKR